MPGAVPDTFYSTSTDSSTFFSFPNQGYYKVTLTMRLADGRDTSVYADVLALDPNPPTDLLGQDTTYCGNFSRTLDAGNPGSDFLWSTGASTQTIQVNSPGTYTVDISNKCYSGTFDITISQSTVPSVNLGGNGFVCNEAPKTLIAGNSSNSYLWNTGETTPSITISSAGTYSVVVTNSLGCSSDDQVTYRDSCPPDLYIPNAFTPNGDNMNDTLIPYVKGIGSYKFSIYDRWGELLYYSEELYEGWDGKHRGSPCPDGVYIWYLSALDSNGNRIVKKGNLTLIR